LSFAYIPSALGRSDHWHVFFNCILIFIFAYSYIRKYTKKSIFILFAILTSMAIYPLQFQHFMPIYGSYVFNNIGRPDNLPSLVVSTVKKIWGIDIQEKLRNRKPIEEFDYDELFADIDGICMPFVRNNKLYEYLNESGKYISLYYYDLTTIGNKTAFDRNLNEMQDKDTAYLLLPANWGNLNKSKEYSSYFNYWKWQFCTYYPRIPQRNGNILYEPLLDYIKTNYQYKQAIGDNYLLYKKIVKDH
jgi:hypothetical protein